MTINNNFNTISLKYFVSKVGVLEDAKTLHSVRNIYKNTKSYRDEIIIHDINGNQIKEHRNFYEIFIDNKPLSFILDKYYENTTPIVYNWVGLLGAFNKKTDAITIKLFLKQEIQKIDVIALYNRENKVLNQKTIQEITKEHGDYIDMYFEEYNHEDIHLYACPRCGEEEHGGYFVNIKKEKDYYQWEFSAKNNLTSSQKELNKDKLIFKFETQQYVKTFYEYMEMKNMNKAL